MLGKANGIVGRAIINKDNFVIRISLARKRTQAVLEKSLAIPVNNNDADLVVFFSENHPKPNESPTSSYFSRLNLPT